MLHFKSGNWQVLQCSNVALTLQMNGRKCKTLTKTDIESYIRGGQAKPIQYLSWIAQWRTKEYKHISRLFHERIHFKDTLLSPSIASIEHPKPMRHWVTESLSSWVTKLLSCLNASLLSRYASELLICWVALMLSCLNAHLLNYLSAESLSRWVT